MNSYDQVEYKSLPFAQSSPEQLYTIAKLHGYDAPNFNSARVLEIGCASGGNLIPLAYNFPNAHFVGFDYSEKQIQKGQINVKNLDLKNIALEQINLNDFDLNQKKFDYIICHGVFSWVDHQLQSRIFELIQNLISETGLAYISYNTYPGWNNLNTIREMMLYHTRNINDPINRIHESREIFNSIQNGLKEKNDPYSQFLNHESKSLKNFEDYYLFHDHLEVDNNPIYFHAFMQQAQRVNLYYLCDVNLQSVLKEKQLTGSIKEKLNSFNDPIEKEQYLDFVFNRRFRSSILTKQNIQTPPKLNLKNLNDFYLTTKFKTNTKVKPEQLLDGTPIKFIKNKLELNSKHPFSKCLIYSLQEQHLKPLPLPDLIQKVSNLTNQPEETIQNYFYNSFNLEQLILEGALQLHSSNNKSTNKVSDHPIAYPVARALSKLGHEVTNLNHTSVKLNEFDQELLCLLDGTRRLENLTEHFKHLNLEPERLSRQLHASLLRFAHHGLLEEKP